MYNYDYSLTNHHFYLAYTMVRKAVAVIVKWMIQRKQKNFTKKLMDFRNKKIVNRTSSIKGK